MVETQQVQDAVYDQEPDFGFEGVSGLARLRPRPGHGDHNLAQVKARILRIHRPSGEGQHIRRAGGAPISLVQRADGVVAAEKHRDRAGGRKRLKRQDAFNRAPKDGKGRYAGQVSLAER